MGRKIIGIFNTQRDFYYLTLGNEYIMIEDKTKLREERDCAVNLKIDISKNDKIMELVPRKSGLFIITKQKILRYRSPDDLDPELNHDDAPWEQSEILPLGSENPLVARTILQTKDLNKFITSDTNKEVILDISWEIMSSLVSLEYIKNRLKEQITYARIQYL